jgi:hypothetical protein
MKRLVYAFVAVAALSAPASADEEASNVPYVAVDQYGRCYAKSVPAEQYGSAGVTKVYSVGAGEDRLIDTYSWYSGRMYLQCLTRLSEERYAVSVVQFGPWARGEKATPDHLAIAFHAGGRLLRSYSTLDIAGSPDNVSASVSHYTVLREVEGFATEGTASVFRVTTIDGRRLTFDAASGALLGVTRMAQPAR